MKPEEIIQKYLDTASQVDDTYVRAAIGKISSDRSKELSSSIQNLHHQIPITVSELRETISRNTDKIITSNEKLAESNVSYIQWMKYLTLALVLVGILQTVISLIKS
jgi:hypothetical protein